MHSHFLACVFFVTKIVLLHLAGVWSVANASTDSQLVEIKSIADIANPVREISNSWAPWGGTYVRLEADGNLSCYSPEGSQCHWGNPPQPPANARALTCGGHHLSLHGVSGYDTPNHWCNNAYADLYAHWNSTRSINAAGDVMCFSRDGVNCTAVQDFNPQVRPIKPLICGEVHRQIYGNTGYSQNGHWCNGVPRPFTLAVTSDPQFPWKNEGDIPSSGNEIDDSRVSIPQAYQSINKYHATKAALSGVIVNGDVTAFGHGWQWDYMHEQLATLKPPVFMGLGNHDYQNNVNDCAQNGCVRNSLNAFEKYLPANVNVDRSVRYYYEFPANYKEFKGSYAWSKEINGVHFVFLNNEPTYSFEASGYNGSEARNERFKIASAISWLDANLAQARANGKPIVLVYHKPGDFKETDGFTRARFEEMVRKYKVSMIFWGHLHGAGSAPQRHVFGGATAVFSGSASTQTYLIAKFDKIKGQVNVYLSKKGNIDNMPLVVSAPLMSPKENLAPDPQPYKVSFVNNGGYVAAFRLQYYNASGQWFQFDSGNKAVGQGWETTVPAGATNVQAMSWAKTGLVWEPWRMIFSIPATGDRCLKTYGTTLNAKWGDC